MLKLNAEQEGVDSLKLRPERPPKAMRPSMIVVVVTMVVVMMVTTVPAAVMRSWSHTLLSVFCLLTAVALVTASLTTVTPISTSGAVTVLNKMLLAVDLVPIIMLFVHL